MVGACVVGGHGEGGMHGRGMCMVGAMHGKGGACVVGGGVHGRGMHGGWCVWRGGGHAWEERQPLSLLECILVHIFISFLDRICVEETQCQARVRSVQEPM